MRADHEGAHGLAVLYTSTSSSLLHLLAVLCTDSPCSVSEPEEVPGTSRCCYLLKLSCHIETPIWRGGSGRCSAQNDSTAGNWLEVPIDGVRNAPSYATVGMLCREYRLPPNQS